MNQFEIPNSSEDLSSLPHCFEVIPIPIKTKSSSNLIDIFDAPSRKSPRKKFYSMDDIFDASIREDNPPLGIMSDCVPSPSSGSSYASSSASDSSTGSSASPTCEISLLERLIRTHPVWFLPSLQRSGALHLLQGREVGNFIVRSSTQPKTMAVSVKLPGNHVEHYLLKAISNRISLENSTHTFETVHQLVAHYCGQSDEIPVCLRVPTPIAEATSRQQLRSLALLGQEFWSVSPNGSGKELSSPSDMDVSKKVVSSGLGSHSSSSQNSLCDNGRKPLRPTTLELGPCGTQIVVGPTPPPIPPRWSRSALLTPNSQPSSVQSTPSEVQSTFSERSGRPGKKKKRHSEGNKAESIHYKDTEILDLFKGTKTVYEDKASDYEDVWSPHYCERSHTPRLSTFKPDVIPTSLTPDVDNALHICELSPNANHHILTTPVAHKTIEDCIVQNKNMHNHRLSFNGQMSQESKTEELTMDQICALAKLNKEEVLLLKEANRKSAGLYSEPVDSITFRRFGSNRNSEPSIRWSQPALSLAKLDYEDQNMDTDYTKKTDSVGEKSQYVIDQKLQAKQGNACRSYNANKNQQAYNLIHRTSLADVSLTNKSGSQMCTVRTNESTNKNPGNKKHAISCVSVDNLCSKKSNKNNSTSDVSGKIIKTDAVTGQKCIPSSQRKKETGLSTPVIQPDVTQRSNTAHETALNSSNISWRVDSSWEFVLLQREEEQRKQDNFGKFPIHTPPNSLEDDRKIRLKKHSGDNNSSACSQTEGSISSANNNSSGVEGYNNNMHRFSRYDNLEGKTDEDYDSGEDCLLEGDGQEKISTPWDSSKWEHLMRLVSESTQQLDTLELSDHFNERPDLNVQGDRLRGSDMANARLSVDLSKRISKVLDVNINVDKAYKAVTGIVRDLATKDDGVFGPTLKSFISCTIAAKVQDPYKVMRNIRQFISGMKNYLVGINVESADLRKEIKKQTENLSDCEFLNIDRILEDILVDLVISPLNLHIRGLIEVNNLTNGKPLRLTKSILETGKNEYTKSIQETHRNDQLEKFRQIYNGFEDSISPMKKLDKWNEFVCQVQEMENYSSDSFLPLLSETLGTVCTANLPSHVDYMIGLLPSSLAEQNNYSISLLQSAIAALRSDAKKGYATITSVRVLVPDERNGTLLKKVVPVRESTTNKEVAKMISSKLGIANPGDYILVTIKNGEEKICPESELVYDFVENGSLALAYKRVDAKIGWPQKIS